MPLAHHAGDVAGGPQPVRQGCLIERQGTLGDGVKTEPLLVFSGQETGTRGGALGGGDITIGEEHAGAGQTVEVRSLDVLPQAMNAEVGVSPVIRKN